MDAELLALDKNQTWEIVDLPPNKKPIGCKWVYKIKYDAAGQIDRYKARLVAKGYTQEYGGDYTEVFSPVAKMATVRFLIAMATLQSWPLHQLDINNAFLHGSLNDDIYMSITPGYKGAKSGQVCKLLKSLYGLKQASREWNAEFSRKLFSFGFKQSSADPCLFLKGHGNSFVCLLVYVYDVLVSSPSLYIIQEVKDFL